MAWWNREIVPSRQVALTGSPIEILSQPEAITDAMHADEMVSFVDIAFVDSAAVEVYRLGGPSPDALDDLDGGSPVELLSTEGVTRIDWPSPLPSCTQVRLLLYSLTGGAVEVRVLQTCRKDP